MNIPYKSFCWSLGTTSFRTKNFNKTIEEQLSLLNEFWILRENQNIIWSGNNELQARYYDSVSYTHLDVYKRQVQSKEVNWLWYPYIPYGKITIIQGDPGEGKTTLDVYKRQVK